ncbi:Tripartite tricarboxylate transporter family receptor [Pigmentiphaga humi]|uniref:Tripartite tricarboxylate transporter family receptor n=1 Tax=Pigmentiphaga humi TaxID=2478468 RepID=A0A3P4AVG5_9BURK|nr:tripartite tricarboxylate transporter substrate binding protein [Pigmentiphaga humi]VCU68007.1 Tripartite tricarboxylate transporter family receptor [Pigmentiphaga humi]
MNTRIFASAALAAAFFSCAAPAAHADAAYPTRAVRLIVPFAPGGPIDQTARIMSQRLTELWGKPVVVENRTGANGVIAAEAAMQAPADGYTLLFSVIHHTVLPSLQKLPYDIEKDFLPVTLAAVYPIILVVRPDLPVRTVQELTKMAKARPGKLSFGHSGYGGGTHLAGELFKMQAGVDLLAVPYKGSAPAMADLLGGHVDLMFSDAPTALPHIQMGKLRQLGISTPERSALAPELPTISESGVPGYEAYSWGGISVRAGTPPAVVAKINADIVKMLKDPATQEQMLKIGAEPKPQTPQEYAAFIRTEIEKWAKVVKQANIRMD